jgi:hypothetical protein
MNHIFAYLLRWSRPGFGRGGETLQLARLNQLPARLLGLQISGAVVLVVIEKVRGNLLKCGAQLFAVLRKK